MVFLNKFYFMGLSPLLLYFVRFYTVQMFAIVYQCLSAFWSKMGTIWAQNLFFVTF